MGNHDHKHDHCLHVNVKFCSDCNVVYCKGCEKEWPEYKWNTSPYYYQTFPNTSPFFTYTAGGTGSVGAPGEAVYFTNSCAHSG